MTEEDALKEAAAEVIERAIRLCQSAEDLFKLALVLLDEGEDGGHQEG